MQKNFETKKPLISEKHNQWKAATAYIQYNLLQYTVIN